MDNKKPLTLVPWGFLLKIVMDKARPSLADERKSNIIDVK